MKKTAPRRKGVVKTFKRGHIGRMKAKKKKPVNPRVQELLDAVDAIQAAHKAETGQELSDSAISYRVRYPDLVRRLREGAECSYRIELRLLEWLAKNKPEPPKKKARG